MAKIIAVCNQKGGVGKTTTSINLAASLGAEKYRIMLVDSDPQGNATMGSGVDKNKTVITLAEVLTQNLPLSTCLQKTEAGYQLAPANQGLTAADVHLLQLDRREQQLYNALAEVTASFDYIFIDCPPALNLLTLNALVAADTVLIPMQCEYFALEGLASLLETVDQVRANLNPRLQIEGILRTLYDGRNRLSTDVSGQLLEHFGAQVYRTCIPRNVRLAEAPSHGLPALLYDKRSPGACAYQALAQEFLTKQSGTQPEPNQSLLTEEEQI